MSRFTDEEVNTYPFYSPRFWAGMSLPDYCQLIADGRFRVSPWRYGMVAMVGGCAAVSGLLGLAQRAVMNRRIESVELQPPLFIIGHWRSGTTLLHEMLALDPQFTYPTTFQCFVPGHFLISRPWLEPLLRLLMPQTRPMDEMPTGPDLPQEEEFALLGLGAPTPYRRIAFCREPPPYLEMLNFEGAKERHVAHVRRGLTRFYKSLVLHSPGRLVVKSPTHTGRIAALAQWFPGARFVHISRHPHKIFPSTVHLWRSLAAVQGFQFPPSDDRETQEYIHDCYQRMYVEGYFRQRDQLPAGSLLEIRFEDLVSKPIESVRRVYEAFDLSGFDEVLPQVEAYWSERSDHRSNRTRLDDPVRAEIDRRWSHYMETFGYEKTPVALPR